VFCFVLFGRWGGGSLSSFFIFVLINDDRSWTQWLTPVILANQKMDTGRITVTVTHDSAQWHSPVIPARQGRTNR
jgi:hypothetical protein